MSSFPYSVVPWGWWDETGQDETGWDGAGRLRVQSSQIQPHPAPPARRSGRSRESAFCSPTSPGPRSGNAIGRESPGSAPRPSLPCRCLGPGPLCQALSRQWDRGTQGNVLSQPPGISFPKPSLNPALPRRGASPTTGMFSQDLSWGCPWGFRGAPGVLTGAVLVPGMAADGLQQEAVVGHGSRAGDRERPPGCQDVLLQPHGQNPSSTK